MPPRFQLDEDKVTAHDPRLFVRVPEAAYEAIYSPARRYIRQIVSDEVEREMPTLVAIQEKYRSPMLDKVFVITGLLGNHAFFLIAIPFLHVFGLGQFARGMTNTVMWSTYFSGFAKDYVSAPRPKSPPITQITRNPAHIFEYGFPSSHTSYIVSTVLYMTYYMLAVWNASLFWVCMLWTLGAIVVAGRIYCGLHSFVDVAGGAVIGTTLALVLVCFHEQFDVLILSTAGPLYIAGIVYVALTSIPRSLDMCPCCVDSFCGTSVSLGVTIGAWVHARLPFLHANGQLDRIAWSTSLTLTQNTLRAIVCVVLVVVWKVASKPILVSLVKCLVAGDKLPAATPDYLDSGSATDVESETEGDCRKAADVQARDSSSDSSSTSSSTVSLDNDYVIPPAKDIRAGRYGTHEMMASAENIARIPIYAGIGFIVHAVAPVFYCLLGLMPK
ncbi:Long-chain base-1-phosphate phosphatase [Dipsacomyces acuminosporus]|nr:Long-chain base-1-phosphate phosphatase [Dipsacomyces acuminosporus]